MVPSTLLIELRFLRHHSNPRQKRSAGADAEAGVNSRSLARNSNFAKYRIFDLLGSGSVGEVYLARDLTLGRKLAIKVLHRGLVGDAGSRLAGLRSEAMALAQLSDPNVVTIYDVGTVDSIVYLAMEYIEGQALDAWRLSSKRSWREVARVIADAGQGLAAAHASQLTHGDVKPNNIMVGNDGRTVVLDFGLARTCTTQPRPSQAGEDALPESSGTYAYMAPEVQQGALPHPGSDQYALAASLFEALTGQLPFRGFDHNSLLRSKQRGLSTAQQRALPRRLRAIIHRALLPEPTDRWPSVQSVVQALRDAAQAHALAPVSSLVAASTAALGLALSLAHAPENQARCARGLERADQVWSSAQRQTVAQAFLATKLPFAARALRHTQRSLDHKVTTWKSDYDRVCHSEAGNTLGLAFDRQMQCLDARLLELHAIIESFRAADAGVVEHAAQALESQADGQSCADQSRPPPTPEERHNFRQIARARFATKLAQFPRAQAILAELAESLDPNRASTVNVEYERVHAELAEALGHPNLARERFDRAFELTRELGDDLRAAEVAIQRFSGSERARSYKERLPEIEGEARASLRRIPEKPRLAAQVQFALATSAAVRGRGAQAGQVLEQALPQIRAALGGDSLEFAEIMGELAGMKITVGDLATAEALHQRSLAIKRRILGANHPLTLTSATQLAWGDMNRGQYPKALRSVAEILAVYEREYQDHPPGHVQALFLEAFLHWKTHDFRQAARDWHDIARISHRQAGPRNVFTIHHEALAARLGALLGHQEHARETLQQLLPKLDAVNGFRTSVEAYTVVHVARLQLALGQVDAAQRLLQLGREHLVNSGAWQGEPEISMRYLAALARVASRQHRFSDAVKLHEQALALAAARWGADNPAVVEYQRDYATALLDIDTEAARNQALLSFAQASRIWQHHFGQDHRGHARIDAGWAQALAAAGKLKAAQARMNLALARFDREQDHPSYRADLCRLWQKLQSGNPRRHPVCNRTPPDFSP